MNDASDKSDLDRLLERLEAARLQAEGSRAQRETAAEGLRERRDALLSEFRELQDRWLALWIADPEAEASPLRAELSDALEHRLRALRKLLSLPASEPDEGGEETPRTVVVAAPPTAPKPERRVEVPAPPAPPEMEPRTILDPIYQEILTLEENQDSFDADELHARIDLLLARLRQVQDGPLARFLDGEERSFMTTRFGLLRSMQKARGLEYLNPLNRNYSTDWARYIERLERRLRPLPERVAELRRRAELESSRRRSAMARRARLRQEGSELVEHLRLFLHGLDPRDVPGADEFRRRVREVLGCLPANDPELVRMVEPQAELLSGREFKSLRRNFKRLAEGGGELPPPVVPSVVGPSVEADREEELRGLFHGGKGLIIGGEEREKAGEILQEFLELTSLEWIDGHSAAAQDPREIERRLLALSPSVVIFLEDGLGTGVLERLKRGAPPGARIVGVVGGQELSRILAAMAGASSEQTPVISSVDEALEKAMSDHPGALLPAFNNASSAKGYPFLDAESVYRALVFLATTYREARAGRAPCPDFDRALRELCGFHYSSHQSPATMGRFEAAYTAQYEGHGYALGEHIGHGTNRDPRYSIRIAFRYLKEKDAVLLGFLGQHQPTAAS